MKKEPLELIILPPKEKQDVSKEDIVKAYAKLIYLLSENK